MKIFQCEMLTTNEKVWRCCDGGLYPECNFCTLNKYPEKKVVKRRKGWHRPPLIVIDDDGGPKEDINELVNVQFGAKGNGGTNE